MQPFLRTDSTRLGGPPDRQGGAFVRMLNLVRLVRGSSLPS
jgi:hypothetical protein